ncbi:AI-2E family transporter [Cellulomonas sp. URHD0024]|uniref:AI-2E family transporter n=1 Tax=Cellulomonas sp. URHD0024 TaxID=1302620 RepID=UPI000403D8E5|nr:AI-2E family transporter [Cellulomonas sp. URHD0024]
MASPLGLAPATRTLITLAAFVVTLAGLHAAGGFLAPIILAAVLVIICHPIRIPLERRGWKPWMATTAVIVLVYLILAVLVAMLVFAGIRFADLIGDYKDDLQKSLADVTTWLASIGVDEDTASSITKEINPTQVVNAAASVASTALSIAGSFFFVLAYVIFMGVDAARYDRGRPAFTPTKSDILERATIFNRGVRSYFVVSATFGAIVAVIDGVALYLLGVPAAVVWAILAFVTNFIPNIGFVIGLIPPMLLAFVVGGWQLALAVLVVYCLVNVTLQVMVQPRFVSDAVNITLTLSFVSVVFWTFIIGPLGAILAVPMTLLTRAMLLQKTGSNAFYFWISGETGPKELASPDDAVPDPVPEIAGPEDRPSAAAEATA